ncbi:hypothetical protein EDB19DRAFT_1906784 [Suillus lakei]|nr:hypothetical protein EDB19DRAFT_1906784 [Suillus lakei]
MSSLPAVGFNDHLVTEYNSMDVDEPSESQVSPDQSPLAPADHPVPPINLDLYLGPDDDLIDCDERPDSADADSNALDALEASMSLDETSTKLHSEQLDLTNEDLHLMLQESRPFGSFEHPGLQSIQDQLHDYKFHNGNLPDPSIPQLLEAEPPF